MNSSAMTMELSVSFVSWINDQLKEELASRHVSHQSQKRSFFLQSAVVAASLACITVAVASVMHW